MAAAVKVMAAAAAAAAAAGAGATIFYINCMNLLNPFEGGIEKCMCKAAHPWGGLDSSKSRRRRGWWLHHHKVVFVR